LIKISIIVPFSKIERDLSLLFDLKKKFQKFELLFIGSSQNIYVKKNINKIKKISKVCLLKNSNRAKCFNVGAHLAKNEIFWFLHLDSKIINIPQDFYKSIDLTKINTFKLKFNNKKFLFNYLGANMRSKILGNPFGDQSYIMTRDIFFYVNLFDEKLKEGEDHEFIIRSICKKIYINILPYSIISSERKYLKKGHFNLSFMHLYKTISQMIAFYFRNLKFIKNFIVIIFTKYPYSSESKKRLRADFSNKIVNKFNRLLQEKTFEEVKKFNLNSNVLALQIVNQKKKSLKYFCDRSKIFISKKNLGLAMEKVYKFFKFKFKKIVFIGTDTPELKAADIKNSIKMLNYHDNYFIRTKDGGFCLFASKDKKIDNIFLKVQYSKKNTFKKFSKLTKNNGVSDYIYEDIDRPNQAIKFISKFSTLNINNKYFNII